MWVHYFINIFSVLITYPTDYNGLLKNENVHLRCLVENEIFRLSVWANPTNDAKRGGDHIGTVEKVMMEVRAYREVPDMMLTPLSHRGSARLAMSGRSTQPLLFTWPSALMSQRCMAKSPDLCGLILATFSTKAMNYFTHGTS